MNVKSPPTPLCPFVVNLQYLPLSPSFPTRVSSSLTLFPSSSTFVFYLPSGRVNRTSPEALSPTPSPLPSPPPTPVLPSLPFYTSPLPTSMPTTFYPPPAPPTIPSPLNPLLAPPTPSLSPSPTPFSPPPYPNTSPSPSPNHNPPPP